MKSFAAWLAASFDPSLSWSDVEWVREIWPGKLIVKGIMNAQDARSAVSCGADAIVVSNHGGRQLDGASSSISVLPSIVSAIGSNAEIFLDSGVQTGQDILKARALGARCCLIGKAYIYGLAAGGEAGVRQAISFMRNEMDVTMMLTGLRNIEEVDRSLVTI